MKQKTKSIIQPLKDLFTALCITCTIAIKSGMTANFYFSPLVRENVAWKTINADVTSCWWFCSFYVSKMKKLGLITLVLVPLCRGLLDVQCHYENLQPTIWVLCQCSSISTLSSTGGYEDLTETIYNFVNNRFRQNLPFTSVALNDCQNLKIRVDFG